MSLKDYKKRVVMNLMLPDYKKTDLESRLNQAFKEWEHKWYMAHNSFIVDDVERILV